MGERVGLALRGARGEDAPRNVCTWSSSAKRNDALKRPSIGLWRYQGSRRISETMGRPLSGSQREPAPYCGAPKWLCGVEIQGNPRRIGALRHQRGFLRDVAPSDCDARWLSRASEAKLGWSSFPLRFAPGSGLSCARHVTLKGVDDGPITRLPRSPSRSSAWRRHPVRARHRQRPGTVSVIVTL